jgi:predicted nucleic acid-binding protein
MTRERVVIDTNVLISGLVSTTSAPPLAVEKAITTAQLVRFCSQLGFTFWVEL